MTEQNTELNTELNNEAVETTNIQLDTDTEQTESNQAAELAGRIISDIENVNQQLVDTQYRYAANMEKINDRLIELNVDSVYLMTLIKSVHIITANVSVADMTTAERNLAHIGTTFSIGMLLKEKLGHLSLEEATEAIGMISNLLSILEIDVEALEQQAAEKEANPVIVPATSL